jgi:hypothetical protein
VRGRCRRHLLPRESWGVYVRPGCGDPSSGTARREPTGRAAAAPLVNATGVCFHAMSVWRNSSERDSCLGFLPLISLRPLRSYFKTCLRLDQRKHWRIDARLSRLQSLRTIGRVLEHPWNKTLSLRGDFQQLPGRKAIESSGVMERAMGIELHTQPKKSCALMALPPASRVNWSYMEPDQHQPVHNLEAQTFRTLLKLLGSNPR